jgi:hypothetical protein
VRLEKGGREIPDGTVIAGDEQPTKIGKIRSDEGGEQRSALNAVKG